MYSDNCQVESINCQYVIMITNDECIFSTINGKTYLEQYKRDRFLCSKEEKKAIIVSDFLLLFFHPNLFYLFEEKQD